MKYSSARLKRYLKRLQNVNKEINSRSEAFPTSILSGLPQSYCCQYPNFFRLSTLLVPLQLLTS